MPDYGNGGHKGWMPGDRRPEPPLKFRDVRMELISLDVIIRQSEEGEYRVCRRGASEDSAYYTTDLQDALDTGRKL